MSKENDEAKLPVLVGFAQNPLVKLLRVLKPYKAYWYEWLASDTNFLTEQEEKAMGYLIGFKGDVISAAKLLDMCEIEYRNLLDALINKLALNHKVYLDWVIEHKLHLSDHEERMEFNRQQNK